MGLLSIVQPLPIAAVAASRGTGADNLRSPDPKEVWADSQSGGTAILTLDLGAVRAIDTILLGYVGAADPAASWSIAGGVGAADTLLQPATTLRVPDSGDLPPRTHALWIGGPVAVRYLALTLAQPADAPPLTAGVPVVGRAFVAGLGQEWGAGRRPIDTGSATSLPSGGFAVVEGARKRAFNWTFGDLSLAETEQLDLIAGALGTTRPGLVIEDPARTAGLHGRIHYGLFKAWQPYERRNRKQTRWEVEIEQWV